MRLRLNVRRHNLPDCPIIWDVNTSTSTPTVSELLDQINDVIPIESAEWGMEDYAVEVKGKEGVNYECLHFQPVSKVMKEEDEVIIRPLLTHDLRVRRISGRHQISSNGKHLVDGVAFGRPMLRRPVNRPPIDIPPRKRRRITFDEEDEDDEDLLATDAADAEPAPKRFALLSKLDEDEDDEDDEDDDDFEPDGGDDEHEEESDEESENTDNRQLVIHAGFEDGDDEEDENFGPDIEEEDSEESEGFEGFQDNQPTSSAPDNGVGKPVKVDELSIADQAVLSDVKNASTKAKICKLHTAFPKASIAVVKFVLEGSDGDISQAFEALARGYVPAQSKNSILQMSSSHSKSSRPSSKERVSKGGKTGIASKQSYPASANAMDLDDEESGSEDEEDALLSHYDQHGLPPGSIKSGKALSYMAEAMDGSPNVKSKLIKFETDSNSKTTSTSNGKRTISNNKTVSDSEKGTKSVKGGLRSGLTSTPAIDLKSNDDEITIDSDDSSNSSSEAESSGSDSSSSDDSTSADDSSEAGDALSSSSDSDGDSDSDSDSSSDSSSDDGAPEVKSSKLAVPELKATNSKPNPSSDVVPPKSRTPVPPRQGKKATQSRNQRRKQGIALANLKEQGILPEDTTASEFKRLEVNRSTSAEDAFAALAVLRTNTNSAKIENGTRKALSEADEFDVRRRELLASLASGGIEVSPRSGKAMVDIMDVDVPKMVSGAPKTAKDTHKEPVGDSSIAGVPLQENFNPTPTSADQPAASRRSKLDVGAGRRLLFGALGMKNPKTKKDEDKLRSELMKDVRVSKTINTPEEPPIRQADTAAVDDDSWRDKIIYRAVECCQEGTVLSEPPFPFVQRWDPQQQNHRGSKKKNQGQAYNEEPQGSKKRKRCKGKQNYTEEQEEYFDESYQPSYEEDAMETQSTEPPARQVESVEHRPDTGDLIQETPDLVELPEDPTTLPHLEANAVQSGMIIAFRQMLMDETTKWQPQISAYRTASVLSVDDSGSISVSLARRDRNYPVKHYDENGQRIWGKFEMPDDEEEEDDEEDNGQMVVTFNDLVEPKIVELAPVSLSTEISKSGMTTDESVTLNNEKADEIPCSHVTETQYFDTDPPASAEMVDVISTPRNSKLEYLQAEALPESITDSAKEDISNLIKEAGFRSNVPSSIVRDFAPNGPERRDEAPTRDEMRTEIMAEINDTSFSPKFNGFGLSPPARQRQAITSPDRQQSSWHTIGSQEPSSAPAQDRPEMIENQESETTLRKGRRKNMIQVTSNVPDIPIKPPTKKINVDKAQAQWEALQPRRKATSLVETDLTLDTIEVDCGTVDPKLSGQSSFTSLVADHGRQPDFSFENMRRQELHDSRTEDVAMDIDTHDGDVSEDEPELPPRLVKTSNMPIENNNMVEPLSEDFPTIEEMLSQPSQSLIKHGKSAPQPSSNTPRAATKKNKKVLAAFDDTQSSATKPGEKMKKALAAFDDSDTDSDMAQIKSEVGWKKEVETKSKKIMAAFDTSDEEDLITPKTSKPTKPQHQTSNTPQSSQVVMDLTVSSDIEPEPEKEKSEANDSDGDDDFQVGWGPKTKSNLTGLKRQESNNLGGTTNAALNAKASKRRF
ncbi:a9183607-2d8d-453d-ae66-0c1c654ffbad [Sclerotinia trifoliorum]|uniref:A9183607-2d8d-453d-ae66-0c1c654ffbad n=1 Tax=Sclerotinia trifoliorum TaxID=28548 RepID=A0A8H2VMD4_9HELO|nr:a9183607-2d8d-453d-ae66-0c1c654ffbad [Sclerotinia trifoliorum]